MKISSFSKSYGSRKVLSFPGFDFECGKVYALLGANGSGKSTFAGILAGIIRSDEKEPVYEPSFSIGYLPQKSYSFGFSVMRNILLNTDDSRKAREILCRLGLSRLEKSNAHRLSGGEASKTALARILVGKYDLLILDEPCASMDMESTVSAEELISEYAKENNSVVIIITHSVSQAARISDEVIFFKDGTLETSGKNPAIFDNPQNDDFTEFLGFFR